MKTTFCAGPGGGTAASGAGGLGIEGDMEGANGVDAGGFVGVSEPPVSSVICRGPEGAIEIGDTGMVGLGAGDMPPVGLYSL